MEPFYWQTWWFKALLVFAFAASAAALAWWYVRTARLKQALALRAERDRIARDMHDEIGSHLSQISLLLPERSNARELIRAALRSLGEIVWAVQPGNDKFAAKLSAFAFDYLKAADLELHLAIPAELSDWPLSAQRRHNLIMIAKEALRNVVQHASASRVSVKLKAHASALTLEIADNGQGFDVASHTFSDCGPHEGGRGLANMHWRSAEIGGRFFIDSQPEKGTTVRVVLERV